MTPEEAKAGMVAEKFRAEQNMTRNVGIEKAKELGLTNTVVEFYTGQGGLTEVYKKDFKTIVNNDINPDSVATHCMDATKFAKELKNFVTGKIDVVDFDCYGCPALVIQEFFKENNITTHAPFVLNFSDGLGQWMKRSRREDTIRKRYLIDGEIEWKGIWNRHDEIVKDFFDKLAASYNLKATRLTGVQTKGKNYLLGSYLFEKI